jgi:hypothetical protein
LAGEGIFYIVEGVFHICGQADPVFYCEADCGSEIAFDIFVLADGGILK